MTSARPSPSSKPSGPNERFRRGREPLTVAVTGFRGFPASWGGVEHQCEETYSRLAARGHYVTVYARSHYVPEEVQLYKGVRIKRLWTLNTKFTEAILHTLLSVLHILILNPQIAHVYAQGPCLLIPLLRLFRPRIRVFFTCVGLDWQRRKWPAWAAAIIRLGEVFSAKFAHHHITVSRELQEYYWVRYRVKAAYVPNGVNPVAKASLAGIGAFQLQPRGYFLFVGRLVPEKRVEDLIVSYLAKPRRSRLVIVGGAAGSEDYVRSLKAIAATDSSVLFVGYQHGEALSQLYANARAFVTASELEGMPLALLEALSHGIVCAASDIAPHREVLEGTPHFVFPVGSLELLSSQLDQLDAVTAAQLEEWGSLGREHVERHFSWDVVVDRVEDLYYKSLGEGLAGEYPPGCSGVNVVDLGHQRHPGESRDPGFMRLPGPRLSLG